MDDGFTGPGVVEFFAGEAFLGIRIVQQGVHQRLQVAGVGLVFLNLILIFHDLAAHPLILVDDRQITHADEKQRGKDDESDDKFRQFAPDAEINIHAASKTRTSRR